MHGKRDRTKRRRQRAWLVCALTLVLLAMTGCGSRGTRNNNNVGNDPLVAPKTPITPLPNSAKGPLPALPTPSSSTATAALAPGTTPALENASELRIGASGNGKDKTAPSTSGVTLSAPQPLRQNPGDKPDSQPLAPPSLTLATGSGNRIQSVDQGLLYLQQLGMKAFRLERLRDTGEWRCICSIADRQNPRSSRTHDGVAEDPLQAVRAVITKVDSEQR